MTTSNARDNAEKLDDSYIAAEGIKCCRHSGKARQCILKLNMKLSYNPAIGFLDIYSREMKSFTSTQKPVY